MGVQKFATSLRGGVGNTSNGTTTSRTTTGGSCMGSKPRPSAMSVLTSFRDDSNLVAFRYENTAQAEPPIPLGPTTSSSTSSSSTSPSTGTASGGSIPPPGGAAAAAAAAARRDCYSQGGSPQSPSPPHYHQGRPLRSALARSPSVISSACASTITTSSSNNNGGPSYTTTILTPVASNSPSLSSSFSSSVSCSASSSSSFSATSSATSPPSSPVVVFAPNHRTSSASSPPHDASVAIPPFEQHPALRDIPPATGIRSGARIATYTCAFTRTTSTNGKKNSSDDDAWKRDSGLAPTILPSSEETAHGGSIVDEDEEQARLFDKLIELTVDCPTEPLSPSSSTINDTASIYSADIDEETHQPLPQLPSRNTIAFASLSPSSSPSSFKLVKRLSLRTGLSTTFRRTSPTQSSEPPDAGPSSDSYQKNMTMSSVARSQSPAGAGAGAGDGDGDGDGAVARGNGAGTGHDSTNVQDSPATDASKTPNNSSPAATTAAAAALSSIPAVAADSDPNFSPLSVAIPDDSLLDDDFMSSLSFSQRGSVMFGGRRAISRKTMEESVVDPKPDASSGADGPNITTTMPPATAAGTTMPAAAKTKSAETDHKEMDLSTTPNTTPPGTASSSAPDAAPAANVKVSSAPTDDDDGGGTTESTVNQSSSSHPTAAPSIRVLPAEVEEESQKVRSLYESGDDLKWEEGGKLTPQGQHARTSGAISPGHDEADSDRVSELHPPAWATSRSVTSLVSRPDSVARRYYELAGGIEDWEDVENGEVDRYGFITPRRPTSRIGTPPEHLKSSQYAPRRRNVLLKRDASYNGGRTPSRKVSARSLNTQNSGRSALSRRSTRSAMRHASNYLPHNRNRRWMDEAGEMLTLAPGLQDIMEDDRVEKISDAIKKKESERSEKWRKMAKVVKKGKEGEGMDFEFDAKNPKLIERTWKGIPDRWRAAAWYSFMATSAKNHEGSATEEQIIAEFHRLQSQSSPDDVQIDLDVPRTINRHIMFRRRYRGGQRLLFRVLHALSLYFPEVGYVQGMASLAATLLCYFDEERCFVMLVRMWRFRGLEILYQPGFEGLMAALKALETQWLEGKEVAKKLLDLCIDPTAYGTRWYLTLFNLSIPFPAQLRVWDVFLLLGDTLPDKPASKTDPTTAAQPVGIEIVHATSAALINALGEVLLDSDFENAMKALTSWIPIKDEDLLMKVTKAEWKAQQGKKKT